MSTGITDLRNFRGAESRTTTSWTGIASANTGSYFPVQAGMPVHVSRPDVTAIVKQPFYVSVRLVGNDYIASSSISNSYEIGETPGRAIVNYLEQLVDELTWLEKHKAELSPSISSDLELLRNYMQIV